MRKATIPKYLTTLSPAVVTGDLSTSVEDVPLTEFIELSVARVGSDGGEPERCCDEADRMELYHNVVIAGGTSCFQGFEDRLLDELTAYGACHPYCCLSRTDVVHVVCGGLQ